MPAAGGSGNGYMDLVEMGLANGTCMQKDLVEMGGAQVALHVLGAFSLTWYVLMLTNCCRKLFQKYFSLSCGGASKRSS